MTPHPLPVGCTRTPAENHQRYLPKRWWEQGLPLFQSGRTPISSDDFTVLKTIRRLRHICSRLGLHQLCFCLVRYGLAPLASYPRPGSVGSSFPAVTFLGPKSVIAQVIGVNIGVRADWFAISLPHHLLALFTHAQAAWVTSSRVICCQ